MWRGQYEFLLVEYDKLRAKADELAEALEKHEGYLGTKIEKALTKYRGEWMSKLYSVFDIILCAIGTLDMFIGEYAQASACFSLLACSILSDIKIIIIKGE